MTDYGAPSDNPATSPAPTSGGDGADDHQWVLCLLYTSDAADEYQRV